MGKEQYGIWFNTKILERYEALGLNTPFKNKIKALVNDWLDEQEKAKKKEALE